MKFETREGSVKEELERVRTLKKGESQLWEGEQRQKGHSQKNCQSIKSGAGEVEKRGKILQKNGDY